MKLLLFIYLSFLCFVPYASIANDKSKALATKIELLLKTNIKYIDKKNDAEKVFYSIMFEVYFINKTKQNLVIPSEDNDLTFSVNYKSTHNFITKPLCPLPVLFFSAGGTVLLKANSYTKMNFEYSLDEYEFNRNIRPDKYNIFQGYCGYLSDKIKSNVVNIPIISHSQKGEISNKNNALHKTKAQTEKVSFSDKKNNPDIVKLKANGEVFINGKKIDIKNIPNKLQKKNVTVFFDKDAPQKDVIAVLEQIVKSNVSPTLKFGEKGIGASTSK